MAEINLQTIGDAAFTPVYAAADPAGDALQLPQLGFAHFKSSSFAAITVTITTPGLVRGYAIADATFDVPARSEVMIALDRSLFAGADGRAATTYSTVTKQATVTTKALTANVATLTTSAEHGLRVGETVTVAGVDATFDGAYVVKAVPSLTTFTYDKVAADVLSAASGGTVTSQALSLAVLLRS